MNTHCETFLVRPTECDLYGRMRPDALFIVMQEGGERHAIELGFGYKTMRALGLFFVLSRVHIRTQRAPRYGDYVVHTTWPGTPNRFFCPRFHTFTLEDGTPLLCASALWVVLDVVTRKTVNPLKAGLAFPDNSTIPMPLELPARLPPLGKNAIHQVRTPYYGDFDVNAHVNNTRYIAWLCDALGTKAMQGHYIGSLIAGYEQEIRTIEPMNLSLTRDEEAFSFRVTSVDGKLHFVAGGSLRKEP